MNYKEEIHSFRKNLFLRLSKTQERNAAMNKKQIVNDPKITSRVDSEIDYRITEPRVNAAA